MRKIFLHLLLTSVFILASISVSAQQAEGAERDSTELQAKPDATIERVRQLSQLSSEQLDSLYRKNIEEVHKPIASAPKAGGRINGHVLDVDGNVIKGKVKVCERDIVDRAVSVYNADFDDGFFILTGIKSTENYLTFEAEGYETQRYPIDRSTYEVRLKLKSEQDK